MAAHVRSKFGVDLVADNPWGGQLWQGGLPEVHAYPVPYAHPFDVLVLCAQEIQPRFRHLDIEVFHCPMDDNYDHMPREDKERSILCAPRVARRLRAGKRVLVTCHQGRNRSGLISAMALVLAHGMRPSEAILAVRGARMHALQNPQFLRFLLSAER